MVGRRALVACRRALSSTTSLQDCELTMATEHVALLTLSRPERGNAVSLAMAESLATLPSLLPAGCRALVVTGRGKAFCTGRDLVESKRHTPEQASRYMDGLLGSVLGIKRLPIPSVAAINGAAFGTGLEIAMACDLRVANRAATLCLPECSLGLFPGAAGTVLLSRLIGPARAKELIFTSRRFSGEEAVQWGVAQQV